MRLDLDNLPHDTALLHRLVRDMAALVGQRDGEIERLRQMIKELQRMRFGRRSERLDPDQLALGLEDLDADIAEAEARREVGEPSPVGPSPRRKPSPEHLARQDVLLDVPGDRCPDCGGPRHAIGESISEMLDWVPATLRVLRIRRPKYACRACATVMQAPAPERVIAGGLATPALLAHVLVSKYADHLPLYRQSRIFARLGVELERSTLAGWVGGASWWLDALHERLGRNIFASGHLFADDTPIPVLDPGRGRTKTGRLWVYARDQRGWSGPEPPAAICFYEPDRKAERPRSHLTGYQGILHVDGYAGFEQLTTDGRITLAACWAHTRRKFYEIGQADGSPIALEAVHRIAQLYALETQVRGRRPAERLALRQASSRPLVDALRLWLEAQLPRLAARGKLAEAIRYALTRWDGLSRFLDDGRIELDTNPVERAIRPVALGRKNHLFAGSDGGGKRWATMASLIETCRLNDVEPHAWLSDVLQRMAHGHPLSQLDALLPWNWKASTAPVDS